MAMSDSDTSSLGGEYRTFRQITCDLVEDLFKQRQLFPTMLGLLNQLQSLWPFSALEVDDLKASEKLVKKLSIPEHTKQFVFAVQDSQTGALLYILCAQNLSERSARDAECLINELRPDAVFVQTGPMLTETPWQEFGLMHQSDSEKAPVPTSSLGVLKRCFTNKISKEEYDYIAGNLVLREIFGVGLFEQLIFAKRAAQEVGSAFFTLESAKMSQETPGVESEDQPSQTSLINNSFGALGLQPGGLSAKSLGSNLTSQSQRFIATRKKIQTELLEPLSSYMDFSQSSGAMAGLSSDKIEPRTNYEPPPFAEPVYPLLLELHDIFTDIPSIGRALAYAQKLFHDVDRGDSIDGQILSEIYTFQVAVEGLRVALNNAGRSSMNKSRNPGSDAKFSDLSPEEKSQCLLAQVLRNQSKNFKISVAVIDAAELAGIRKYWNTAVPLEVEEALQELVMSNEVDVESSKDDERKGIFSSNPVVAVGAGATAVLGASSLSKVVPASTVVKVVTLNIPASLKLFLAQSHKAIGFVASKILGPSKVLVPGFTGSGAKASTIWKASASAGKIRAVTHSVIASAEKTSFSAVRTSFYEIMRKRKVQRIGFLPWTTFGCSLATCAGLVVYGDGIECVVESLPSAPAIASMGRGIQNLQHTSQAVSQVGRSRIQMAIESLMYRFKKTKTH